MSAVTGPTSSLTTYLEEMDDGFDRYVLVNWMKRKLRLRVMELIRSEIAAQCQDNRLTPDMMRQVAPAILRKVMHSTEVLSFIEEQRKVMAKVAGEMTENIDAEVEAVAAFRPPDSISRELQRSDSGSDSLTSTWNQSHFIFLHPGQYHRLAEKLNPYNEAEVKTEALNTLLLSQLSDVVGSEAWAQIRLVDIRKVVCVRLIAIDVFPGKDFKRLCSIPI